MSIISSNFSYFDQFLDTEVDLTRYFDTIKKDNDFNYSFTSVQPIRVTLKNMFSKITLVENFKRNILFFDSYEIKDGDTIENIAYRTYNDIEAWWVIAIFNNIKNLYNDFPMTEKQLIEIAEKMNKKDDKYSTKIYYEMLFERNEKKRNILLLNRNYLNDVIAAFRKEYDRYNA